MKHYLRHCISPFRNATFLLLAGVVFNLPIAGNTWNLHTHPDAVRQHRKIDSKTTQRPPEISSFVSEVETAPPEIASDAMLRLVASGRVTDKEWKQELVDRAFVLAERARQPLRKKSASGVSPYADITTAYLQLGYDLQLDVLSLRIRAVRAMLALDVRRAKELFDQLPAKLSLTDVSCSDAMVYHISDFYELAGEVAFKAFDAEEVRLGVRARFIQTYIDGASSPVQLVPLIKLVIAAGYLPEEQVVLVPALTRAFGRVSTTDNRSFFSAIFDDGFAKAASGLSKSLASENNVPAAEFTAAAKQFIHAGLTGERCAEYQSKKTWSGIVREISPLFDAPPKYEDLAPSSVGSTSKDVTALWLTSGSKIILNDYRILRFGKDTPERFGPGNTLLLREDINSPDWDAELLRFVVELEQWDGKNEPAELITLSQQQGLYVGLLELAPEGDARTTVFTSWLKSLGHKRDGELELLRYHYVLEFLKAVRESPTSIRDDLLTRATYSNDPALSAFANEVKLKL